MHVCIWMILSLWFNNEEWCVTMFLCPYDDLTAQLLIINTANPFNLSLSLCWLYEGTTTVVSVGELHETHMSILKLIENKWKPACSLHLTLTKMTKTIINIQHGITLTFLCPRRWTISPFVDYQQILHVDQAALAGFWSISSRIRSNSVHTSEGHQWAQSLEKQEVSLLWLLLSACIWTGPPGPTIRAASSQIRPRHEELRGLDARKREQSLTIRGCTSWLHIDIYIYIDR